MVEVKKIRTNNAKDMIEIKRQAKSNFMKDFLPKSFANALYSNINLQNKMIPNSKRAKKTKKWHVPIHTITWVAPSDLGDFEIILIVIVTSVKNRVVSKAILPGITSGGITNPI